MVIFGVFLAVVFGALFMYCGVHAIYAGFAMILAAFATLFGHGNNKNE